MQPRRHNAATYKLKRLQRGSASQLWAPICTCEEDELSIVEAIRCIFLFALAIVGGFYLLRILTILGYADWRHYVGALFSSGGDLGRERPVAIDRAYCQQRLYS